MPITGLIGVFLTRLLGELKRMIYRKFPPQSINKYRHQREKLKQFYKTNGIFPSIERSHKYCINVVGEEFKTKNSKSGFSWIIDPIDGTRSFIIGSPTWSNLISVNYKNIPIFGLVNFPMLKKYYITGINRASYLVENNKFKKLKVSKSKSLNSSKIAGGFFGWLSLDEQKKISKLTRLMRYPCSDALSYCQLCEGKLDVVLQCYNKIWDIHPTISLIKNAGGYITTWKGRDPRVGGSIVASSSMKLHKKILNLLKPVC